jgi:amidohydrolase
MLKKARAIGPKLVEWRREFHRHPELGFNELRTSGRVAEVLNELGYNVRTGVGKTGVAGELGDGSPVVAIRADMDALPIQEANQVPYASQIPGLMHACGHDAHTSMLLGVATLLKREKFPGRIRLLFQPSEEVADEEGISGAPRMIEDGVMQGVDQVISLHVDPVTPVGAIRIAAGPFSGGVDSFFATIYGEGGHGARPHELVDPIYIASHVILVLHGIVSRRLNPFAPAVISIGSIHGGHTENVIPEHVDITGTIRFMDEEIQRRIHSEMEQAFKLTITMGGKYELKFEIGTPPMNNDPQVVDSIKQVASDLLGSENVQPPLRGLGAEDFGCFSEIAPGAMFALGCRIEDDERLIHNPRFDIDERCLPIGTAILAETALRFLKNPRPPS